MDYTIAAFSKQFASTPFDVIIDPVGGDTEEKSYAILAKTGHYSHIKGRGTDAERSKTKQSEWKDGRKYTATVVKPNAEQLNQASGRHTCGSSSTCLHVSAACMAVHVMKACASPIAVPVC